ncbi:hypothetical protein KQI37_08860 [Bacillus halotolerans]|nr:hypothetical protein [Bacillus halotolerans]MCV0022709.1 hypothetical protein [Bacillus sp. XT-2]QVN26492.1 hypothetical protein JYG31_15025 [Bacillus halotolerans]
MSTIKKAMRGIALIAYQLIITMIMNNEIALQENDFLTALHLFNARPANNTDGVLFASATLPFQPFSQNPSFSKGLLLKFAPLSSPYYTI